MTTETLKTIDITPTWRGLLPALVEVAANGASTDGRRNALTELGRVCDMADAQIARAKVAKQAAALMAEHESTVTRRMRSGGSFCAILGELWEVADAGNRALLLDAFGPLLLRFAPPTSNND